MKIVTEKCFQFTKTKMLLCLHWSGPVCIIFRTEWRHCQSVVMVTYAFIVCSHRSEGCRKITHPPDRCSGPGHTKAPSQTEFFSKSSETSWIMENSPREKEQLESAIPLYTDASTADVPLYSHRYLPWQALPASFCKA